MYTRWFKVITDTFLHFNHRCLLLYLNFKIPYLCGCHLYLLVDFSNNISLLNNCSNNIWRWPLNNYHYSRLTQTKCTIYTQNTFQKCSIYNIAESTNKAKCFGVNIDQTYYYINIKYTRPTYIIYNKKVIPSFIENKMNMKLM